jgi:hypothetical protein
MYVGRGVGCDYRKNRAARLMLITHTANKKPNKGHVI